MDRTPGKAQARRTALTDRLAEVYEPVVRAAARRLEVDFEAVRDAVHEVVVRVLEAQAKSPRRKRLRTPKAYLTKSAVGAHQRSQGEDRKLILLSELSPDKRIRLYEETSGPARKPADVAADRELVDLARGELAELSDRQRRVIALRCADLAYREIAEILGITPGNARVHYHAGIAALRKKSGVAA